MNSYLIFHSLAELFSVAIALSIFTLAWNSHRWMQNSYLLQVGIAALFVGGFDLFHTLAYKGMGVFTGFDANLPTQLWIAARYLQSLSLLAAPFFLLRPLSAWNRPARILLVYALVSGLLMAAIWSGLFPVCYVEGAGLTPFKKISEIVISSLLLLSMLLLYRLRDRFELRVWRLLLGAIGASVLAELAFTFYVSVYDLSNFAGHVFKVIAFYLLYLAIVRTGLQTPFELLFRDLVQSQERYQRMFAGHSAVKLIIDPASSAIIEANPAACQFYGYAQERLRQMKLEQITVMPAERAAPVYQVNQQGRRGLFIDQHRLASGEVRDVEIHSVTIPVGGESLLYAIIQDITERKQAEDGLKKALQEKQILLRELQHRVKNSFAMITSLVGLMSHSNQEPAARMAMADLGDRVRAITELYELLYETDALSETRLDVYCAKVLASLQLSGNIRLEGDYDPVMVPVKIAAPVGLILTELITNAIKYAFPNGRCGTIAVRLVKTPGGARLVIADDGVGLPKTPRSSSSLGLVLVDALTRQIEGCCMLESGQGTRCTIEFPTA